MARGKPRGKQGAIPVYVYDPRVKRKRYIGSFATQELADAAERDAKAGFGTRWSGEDDPGWRSRLLPDELSACEDAMARGEQLVYFMQGIEGGPIKIGIAVDPDERLQQLQFQGPLRLVVRHAMPGGAALELELHLRFSRSRLWGEWFAPVPDLRRLCNARPSPKDWASVDVVRRLEKDRDYWEQRALAAETAIDDATAALEGAAKAQRLRAVS